MEFDKKERGLRTLIAAGAEVEKIQLQGRPVLLWSLDHNFTALADLILQVTEMSQVSLAPNVGGAGL
jgi:hypothetical protein